MTAQTSDSFLITTPPSLADQAVDGPVSGSPPGPSVEQVAQALVDGPWLAELIDSAAVGEGGLRLTGEGGFLPALIKAVLEKGLQAELADHLGYDKGDPAGRGSPNSRNGSTPKTLSTEVGNINLATPRDRDSSFEPRLVPKGARRLAGGLDEMIISLFAGGMTVRDIEHHLHRTLGVELSHETISNITDAVLEEVKAWQNRPLDPGRIPVVVANQMVMSCSRHRAMSWLGLRSPRQSRGLSFSSVATSRMRPSVTVSKSIPLGKYCRSRPLVFSLLPRCQGEWGSAK